MKQIRSYEELKGELMGLAEDEYREFTSGLIPSERPILGVRIPKVRELAGRVPRELIVEFLQVNPVLSPVSL